MRTLVISVVGVIFITSQAMAQFGDLLKEKGMKFLKEEGVNLLSKELHKTKAKFDSTSFSYAISLSDKAAQFESKDKLADVVTLGAMFVDKDKDKTPLEEAREYMDVGEMAYAANGFKMAETYFIAANLILVGGGYEEHPLYGRGLANLGLLYNSMGRYAAAEELTTWALNIREKYRGRNSKDYAASLNNLAVLDKDLGNYNKAEKEITEAIAINKAVLGNESIAYAIGLNNRGVLYQTLGRYAEAEKDMQQALAVAAKTLKRSTLQYTRLQSNLAILYQQQGKYAQAEEIYRQAITAIAKNPTKNKKSNPDYAHMIENLASLYTAMGRYDEAEELYLEALAVYNRKFDDRYSGYGLTAARLGALYLLQDDYTQAGNYLTRAENVLTNTYGPQHPYTVDLQVQLAVLNWRQGKAAAADRYFARALDKSLEFVGKYFAPMSETEKAMFWKTLQPRFERYYAFAASQDSPEILQKAMQYRLATKAMLLSGSTKVRSQILASGDSALIKDYQTWLDQKGMLAHYYSMSQEDLREQKINLDSLDRAANAMEKSLSERSGLFNEAYRSSVPTVAEIQGRLQANEKAVEIVRIAGDKDHKTAYLAIILSPAGIDKVVLAHGDELEGKYYKRYRNLIKYKKEDTYSYAQYWQPIEARLGQATKVYISLDGVYNQVSLNSLMVSPGNFVVDLRSHSIVSSLRDLKRPGSSGPAGSKSATLVGNPDYASPTVDPLPGTGREVATVKEILDKSGYQSRLLTGTTASEGNLKQVRQQKIVHVATHGFFIADPKGNATSVFSIPLYNVNENVLLRSGLLFAGIGRAATRTNDLSQTDNGILTGYEVMNLALENTDLVVLSACETGLGDVMSGEGVYGLQRAFMVAGASYVIMSLWKVDDDATQQLMVHFYNNWLQGGDIETAFSKAQKQVRNQYNHPYYWGAFVLLKR